MLRGKVADIQITVKFIGDVTCILADSSTPSINETSNNERGEEGWLSEVSKILRAAARCRLSDDGK